MRAMSTKYVESEARLMSLVLIEGIAEMRRQDIEILSVDLMYQGRELKTVGEPKAVFVLGTARRLVS